MSADVGWIANHCRMASRIATSIRAFAKRQNMDVLELLAALDSDGWRMVAGLAGERDGYSPSVETRVFVVEMLRHEEQRACMGCNLRQGTRQATASGRAGTEYCESCYRAEFPAVAA